MTPICAQCKKVAVWIGLYSGAYFCDEHGAHLIGVQRLSQAVIRDNPYRLERDIQRFP